MNEIVTMPDLVRKVMEGLPVDDPIDEAMARLLALAKIEDKVTEENIGVHTAEEIGMMLNEWLKRTEMK